MSKKTKKIVIITTVIVFLAMALLVLNSKPFKQNALERRLNEEIETNTPKNGLILHQRSDFGDVLLARPEDWGVQYVYTYSDSPEKLISLFVDNLKRAGYEVKPDNDRDDYHAFNNSKNVHLRIKLAPNSSAGPAIFVIGKSFHE